ncbi:protein of unknown function (Putative phage tail protein) [Magnetospirillum sp. XM-1]|uniref:hypothetical protein n=1 Tax=Magnetospirillum sp. XM-1 TaxID=1663591 RepID=UPI00073DBC1A|nr:hypothetical protein [Magnetospirillum sp. XM-1]CUW41151.1 protein of unknown function (Putative phage tail protein) [Magnetospirillum sp. XM-1]
MHRIDHSTAQVNKFGAGKPGFTGGNPTTATPATRFTPDWCDDVQENIVRVIEGADIALVKGNGDQLYVAIQTLIAANPSLGAGEGLEELSGELRVKLNGATLARTVAGLSLNLGAANVWAGQQSCQVAVLTDAAAIAWDVVATGNMAKVTIAATRLLAMPTGHASGTRYALRVIHGAPNTTLSFAAGYKAVSALALSTSNGAVDILIFESDGTYMSLVDRRLDVLGA